MPAVAHSHGTAHESHRRVLVVDDDVRARTAVARLIQEEGFEAGVAADGEEASGLLSSWRPDLVVTDLNMPRLDGRGLVQRVRRVLPGTPVIVMSARGSAEVALSRASATSTSSRNRCASTRSSPASTTCSATEFPGAARTPDVYSDHNRTPRHDPPLPGEVEHEGGPRRPDPDHRSSPRSSPRRRGRTTVVSFESPGCGPCQTLRPVLEALAREFRDLVRSCCIPDAAEGWLAARWHLPFVPTLVFLQRRPRGGAHQGRPRTDAVRKHVLYLLDRPIDPSRPTGRGTRCAPASARPGSTTSTRSARRALLFAGR